VTVVYETAHYKVHCIPLEDYDCPKWGIANLSGELVFTYSLDINYGCPAYQVRDICDALEEAYIDAYEKFDNRVVPDPESHVTINIVNIPPAVNQWGSDRTTASATRTRVA
jgi:hypothetical protein